MRTPSSPRPAGNPLLKLELCAALQGLVLTMSAVVDMNAQTVLVPFLLEPAAVAVSVALNLAQVLWAVVVLASLTIWLRRTRPPARQGARGGLVATAILAFGAAGLAMLAVTPWNRPGASWVVAVPALATWELLPWVWVWDMAWLRPVDEAAPPAGAGFWAVLALSALLPLAGDAMDALFATVVAIPLFCVLFVPAVVDIALNIAQSWVLVALWVPLVARVLVGPVSRVLALEAMAWALVTAAARTLVMLPAVLLPLAYGQDWRWVLGLGFASAWEMLVVFVFWAAVLVRSQRPG